MSTTPFAWGLTKHFRFVYIQRENELGEYPALSEDWSSAVSMKDRVDMIKDWQIIV